MDERVYLVDRQGPINSQSFYYYYDGEKHGLQRLRIEHSWRINRTGARVRVEHSAEEGRDLLELLPESLVLPGQLLSSLLEGAEHLPEADPLEPQLLPLYGHPVDLLTQIIDNSDVHGMHRRLRNCLGPGIWIAPLLDSHLHRRWCCCCCRWRRRRRWWWDRILSGAYYSPWLNHRQCI